MSVSVMIGCDLVSDPHCPLAGSSDPRGVGQTVDDAYAHALREARRLGWVKRKIPHLSGRVGWVCPVCLSAASSVSDAAASYTPRGSKEAPKP